MRWRELSEHNETKIYLKYFGLTRHGLKFPDKPIVYPKKDNLHLNTHNTHTNTI